VKGGGVVFSKSVANIGPVFFHETVNSDQYINDILNPFFSQLTAEERQYGYFQQDNATAHTVNAAMVAIRDLFEDRTISRGLWPPRSPDLSFLRRLSLGKPKRKGYKNNPRITEALQNEITHVIGLITMDEFQNLFRRCKACLRAEGGHFQQLLENIVSLCYFFYSILLLMCAYRD
jgi:hypothetical protein